MLNLHLVSQFVALVVACWDRLTPFNSVEFRICAHIQRCHTIKNEARHFVCGVVFLAGRRPAGSHDSPRVWWHQTRGTRVVGPMTLRESGGTRLVGSARFEGGAAPPSNRADLRVFARPVWPSPRTPHTKTTLRDELQFAPIRALEGAFHEVILRATV